MTAQIKLSKAQTKILSKLEEVGEALSVRQLGDYHEKETYCGVGEASVRTNCAKLVQMGLVVPRKASGIYRGTAYLRTNKARPESAEAAKARKLAEKEAADRRAGKIATCQGCLRAICLHDGQDKDRRRMVRHGWESGSPGDKHAWHVGQCLGTAEKPLEDDYKVALRCMQAIINKIEAVFLSLDRLMARPATVIGTESRLIEGSFRYEQVPVAFARDDKDIDAERPSYYNEYEKELRKQVKADRRFLGSLASDLGLFKTAVAQHWDNEDTSAMFSKAEPAINNARTASEVTSFNWNKEAA